MITAILDFLGFEQSWSVGWEGPPHHVIQRTSQGEGENGSFRGTVGKTCV